MRENSRHIFKILLLGEASVGKTALLRRFAHRIFEENYKATLGVDMVTKKVDEKTIQIWDFSGQSLFGNLRSRFYTGASGAFLIYDVTNDLTFNQLERWVDELTINVGRIPLLVIGNKIDIDLLQKLPKEETLQYAKSLGTEHYLTSAKTGENVDKAFFELISLIERQN